MTRRFDGAITTPEDVPDSTRPPLARRPPRPTSIEIAAAILIVGGFVSAVATIAGALGLDPAASDPGARPVIVLLVVLNLLTVGIGILVRRGVAWIVCVNVVAVLLFIELTAVPSGSATAALLAILDAFVFVVLIRNRDWFDWRAPVEHRAR
jgi:hypothetical protein